MPKHCIREPGCYHGFDAVEALIDAAGRIFDPSRFHFRHHSVFNEEYNPDPSAPTGSRTGQGAPGRAA